MMSSRLICAGVPGQAVATGPTQPRLDDAGPAQVAEHLRQEADRDVHLLGDAASGDDVLTTLARQRHHGADGIGAAMRQFQPHEY